jgi:hypothetical protein
MIEKKISYEINIEKPSKTKPVKQGGVFNYLGKQKTVNAPRHWRSSPKHPIAHLSYITKDEQKILIDLNLYGSLKGKPNKGPFGLPSLQGSGSGSGGDGGSSSGDSGPGGSDDGSSQGVGSGEGESTGDANDQGGTEGPGGMGPGAEGGFGIGPGDENAAAQSVTADDVSMQAQAEQEDASRSAAAEEDQGIMSALAEKAKEQIQESIQKAIDNPFQTAIGIMNPFAGLAFGLAKDAYAGFEKGVVAPGYESFDQDYGENVQTSTQSPDGGIVDLYAPLYNSNTGNPTMDAYIRQLRINLGLPV